MKKSLLLLLLLLIIAAIAFYTVKNKSGDNIIGSYDFSDRAFAVEDVEDIDYFNIVQKNAPPLQLKRKDNYWMVNDKYRADANVMLNLLDAIRHCRMDYIPNPAAQQNIIDEIGRIGIKIEVFSKSGKKLKSYHIGGNTSNEDGTHFLMDGSQQPYVMIIPGLMGSIRNRFAVTELMLRDKVIFRNMSKDIKQISMEYPKDKSKGFILDKDGSDVSIKPFYSKTKKIDKVPNPKLVESYLKEFDKLASEWIENDNPRRDSIKTMTPFCILNVSLKDGTQKTLSLVPLNDVIDPEVKTVDLESLQKVERYFGETSWGDFYLIQHRLIKGFLRPYEFFYEGS